MTCCTRDSPGKLTIIKWSRASDLPMPDLSLSRSSTIQSTSSPTDVVNAAKPIITMKIVVPILAPTVVEEKSPYPMVVIEMTLYQRLSPYSGRIRADLLEVVEVQRVADDAYRKGEREKENAELAASSHLAN